MTDLKKFDNNAAILTDVDEMHRLRDVRESLQKDQQPRQRRDAPLEALD